MATDTVYPTRSPSSRDKIVRFFGEYQIPLQVGGGSSQKLERFYGSIASNNTVSTPISEGSADGNQSLPNPLRRVTNSTQPTAPVLIAPNPRVSELERILRHGSTLSFTSLDSDSESVISTYTAYDSTKKKRWSLPSAEYADTDSLFKLASNYEASNTPSVVSVTRSTSFNSTNAMNQPSMFNSTKKITDLLGETCPVDVSVRQIQKEGLAALLRSKLPLSYFLAMLLIEQNAEILFFILDVIEFEQTVFLDHDNQFQTAEKLFQTYLSQNSLLEINISYKSKRAVADSIKLNSRTCFSKAKEEMFVLLEQAYDRFRGNIVHNMGIVSTFTTTEFDGEFEESTDHLLSENRMQKKQARTFPIINSIDPNRESTTEFTSTIDARKFSSESRELRLTWFALMYRDLGNLHVHDTKAKLTCRKIIRNIINKHYFENYSKPSSNANLRNRVLRRLVQTFCDRL
ncbi:hypothetical protein HK096_009123 [Nowakowskiella sp. JEL0078]|nr:hypothetical protein HK096_009123 [Nowakowskiella sp. JEL0078]